MSIVWCRWCGSSSAVGAPQMSCGVGECGERDLEELTSVSFTILFSGNLTIGDTVSISPTEYSFEVQHDPIA